MIEIVTGQKVYNISPIVKDEKYQVESPINFLKFQPVK